ncbi:MAG TPA: dTDP-glucose 4,6-dehydratase [Mesotoga sp.]|nr:dTDP-glucose 4,6-dehydratase [Mesotoga sp.]
MTILVTGMAGFIGSNFVYYYLRRHPERRLIGLDNLTYAGNLDNLSRLTEEEKKRFAFIKGDICDTELVDRIFSENEIDGVINFAAESHVDRSIHDPQIFLKTNILGTQVLLNAAKKHWQLPDGKWRSLNSREGEETRRDHSPRRTNNEQRTTPKFLQISTDEVYGALGPTGFFTEKTPLDPHSPYSASKASADLIVKAYHDTFGLPVNITRCSNNYGPYQFPEKLIPLMINNALNHKPLPVYGDGKQIRDWLYVKDHCRAIDMVFDDGQSGEVYNIGGHNERENIYIVKRVIEILREKTGDGEINESLIKHVTDRLGHDRRYGIDPTKITQELGWKPTIMFDQGIEMTIDWYLNNREWVEGVISGEYLEFYNKNYKI